MTTTMPEIKPPRSKWPDEPGKHYVYRLYADFFWGPFDTPAQAIDFIRIERHKDKYFDWDPLAIFMGDTGDSIETLEHTKIPYYKEAVNAPIDPDNFDHKVFMFGMRNVVEVFRGECERIARLARQQTGPGPSALQEEEENYIDPLTLERLKNRLTWMEVDFSYLVTLRDQPFKYDNNASAWTWLLHRFMNKGQYPKLSNG